MTTQRIGRALRLDKNNPEKKATVVDFVIEDSGENDNNADADRAEWLTELSQTRDANMRNKIIENAIDSVVNASNTSSDFKLAFRQYVKNKFDDNAKESDLKRILTLIEDDEEDIQV